MTRSRPPSGTSSTVALGRTAAGVAGALLVGALMALPLATGTAAAQPVLPAHGQPGPSSSPMPGMDHDMGGMDMGDMDMGGMDHGDGTGHDHGTGSGHEDMPGMTHDDGPPPNRPRTAVLGGFVVVNGAAMGSAAVLRHRTKGRPASRRRRAATTRKADQR